MTRFGPMCALADAVLLEGYVLYPYRASAPKNHFRWSFGVLAPREWSDAGGCEPSWNQTQCLIEGDDVAVGGRVRFFQIVERTIESAIGEEFRQVSSLEVGGQLLVPWQEGNLCEIDFDLNPRALAAGVDTLIPLSCAAARRIEPIAGEDGTIAARVVHASQAVHGRICARLERLDAPRPLQRLTVRVDNLTPWARAEAARHEVMRASCASTHLLLEIRGGQFVSLQDPPEWARPFSSRCENVRAYPVLAGEPGRRDLVLSAPIILHDHPQLAPESPGDFYDATEIDELLALRTATLTDEEKRHVRATDARARAVLDRVENMPPEVHERLHGAIRRQPLAPRYGPGSRVRLRPGSRRTDAQDLLFAGHIATVEEIRQDVDGREYLAVLIEDDPAADLHRWYGRYLYYTVDEVEPVEDPS